MKKLLLLWMLLYAAFLKGEAIYFPELQNLFESDLVVDANYMRLEGNDFFIRINAVLKGNKYGLEKDDYIRLPQLESGGCGFPVYHNTYKRNRYYLKKSEKGWVINRSTTQSICDVNDFDHIYWRIEPRGNPQNFNENIIQFLTCYSYNKENGIYYALISEERILEISKTNMMVREFERSELKSLNGYGEQEIIVQPDPMNAIKEEQPMLDCSLAANPAKEPFGSEEEFRNFLLNNENPLSEYGVEGRVIVQFEIDTSGAAIDAHVVRGIYPVLDSIALNKVENMPKWTAALDYAKKPIACKSILPFTFKIDSNKP